MSFGEIPNAYLGFDGRGRQHENLQIDLLLLFISVFFLNHSRTVHANVGVYTHVHVRVYVRA